MNGYQKTTPESGRRTSAPTVRFNHHNVQNKPQTAAIHRFNCTLREFERPNSLTLNFKKPSSPIKTTGRPMGNRQTIRQLDYQKFENPIWNLEKRINHQSEKQSHP
jgi:hypothetical protein